MIKSQMVTIFVCLRLKLISKEDLFTLIRKLDLRCVILHQLYHKNKMYAHKLYRIGHNCEKERDVTHDSIKFWHKKHERDANDTVLIHRLNRIDDTPYLLMLHARFYAKMDY